MQEHGLQSTPLVADGIMYLATSGHRVYALDASTGREIWRYVYDHRTPHPGGGQRPVETVRGLALGHGHVYFWTDDNFVVAVKCCPVDKESETGHHVCVSVECTIDRAILVDRGHELLS